LRATLSIAIQHPGETREFNTGENVILRCRRDFPMT
jgi:hypothetical protein